MMDTKWEDVPTGVFCLTAVQREPGRGALTYIIGSIHGPIGLPPALPHGSSWHRIASHIMKQWNRGDQKVICFPFVFIIRHEIGVVYMYLMCRQNCKVAISIFLLLLV